MFLKEMVKQGQQTKIMTITERLPHFVTAPCNVEVVYRVEKKEDFYLIHLHVKSLLLVQCQRCLDEFNFSYDNNTVVAVCPDNEHAERLLEHYECIVSESLQVNLEDIIIDELHLYAPQFHPDTKDCSSEINQFLAKKNQTY